MGSYGVKGHSDNRGEFKDRQAASEGSTVWGSDPVSEKITALCGTSFKVVKGHPGRDEGGFLIGTCVMDEGGWMKVDG